MIRDSFSYAIEQWIKYALEQKKVDYVLCVTYEVDNYDMNIDSFIVAYNLKGNKVLHERKFHSIENRGILWPQKSNR